MQKLFSLSFLTPMFTLQFSFRRCAAWPQSIGRRFRTPTLFGSRAFEESSQELEKICAAVIVPGFLSGAGDFSALAHDLTSRGIPTVVVPMPVWHWIPCLGGRSSRPILERIDHTVQHLAANGGNVETIPPFSYSLWDFAIDFHRNPGGISKVGGSDEVDGYPRVDPRGSFQRPSTPPRGKVALIGHSAGGWISRAYLSERSYGGKVYKGARLVHTLVTLGTPHLDAPGPAFSGVRWVNREGLPPGVRGLAVGGTGTLGTQHSGSLTVNSYAFCTPPVDYAEEEDPDEEEWEEDEKEETSGVDHGGTPPHVSASSSRLRRRPVLDGDGITPIDSALGMPGTPTTVSHSPFSGAVVSEAGSNASSSSRSSSSSSHRSRSNVETMRLAGVTHFPWSDVFGGSLVAPTLSEQHKAGMPWYGSAKALDEWATWLAEACGCVDQQHDRAH